jgi:phage anti-repressor protein
MRMKINLIAVNKKLKEKIEYARCNCIMNPRSKCKKVWYEIKVLHHLSIKMEKEITVCDNNNKKKKKNDNDNE